LALRKKDDAPLPREHAPQARHLFHATLRMLQFPDLIHPAGNSCWQALPGLIPN